MACQEKDTLLMKYQTAVEVYSSSVAGLSDAARSIPQVEFVLLWKLAENTRVICQDAQRTLQRHIAEHGC